MKGGGEIDAALVDRLRELSLVEIDALCAGVPADRRGDVLAVLADDLRDALEAARRRAEELRRRIGGGPDPLAALDAPPKARASGDGAALIERAREAAASRAAACRELSRIDRAAALVIPRLAEVERLLAVW